MNFILWLIVGAVVGALASAIARTHDRNGILRNVGLGVVGALVGGWLIWPESGAGGSNGISVGSFLVALAGAACLVAVVNIVRRGRAR